MTGETEYTRHRNSPPRVFFKVFRPPLRNVDPVQTRATLHAAKSVKFFRFFEDVLSFQSLEADFQTVFFFFFSIELY